MGTIEQHIIVQWENGVSEGRIPARDKSHAFQILDGILNRAEYPDSYIVGIQEDGKIVWAQQGSHVLVNT